LEDQELRKRLLGLIDDNPCPPGWRLQVELLEDIFQDTSEEFSQFLAALVKRHVRIAIDDFGTGYSSLARLISLPIQAVKIDRAFICQLTDDTDSPRTLLRTMLTMLTDLNLEVTAEGVEDEQQRQWLLRHGTVTAQGFLFSVPISISESITLLQKLDYRPRAIPIKGRRIQDTRRRRLRSYLRLPFLGGRRNSD
jgi:EAL domain-containing protein (putative c-di-GMP-specific phosphodiesterase class I)